MTRASTQQKRNFLRYDRDLRNTNKAKRNPCGDTENGYSKHEFKIKCENSHEKEKWKPAYKPGSVESSHSSAILVTKYLKRPTREPRGPRVCPPIWSCSGWGLPCHAMLPPARCALTAPFHPYLYDLTATIGGIFSAALSVGSRRPGVTWHPAHWSPDFPPRTLRSDCPADFRL